MDHEPSNQPPRAEPAPASGPRPDPDPGSGSGSEPGGAVVEYTAAVALSWIREGREALVVRPVGTTELGPRTSGDVVVARNGEQIGTLFRGALDAEVRELARRPGAAAAGDGPRLHRVEVSFESATAVGLTCGGRTELVLQPLADIPVELWDDLAAGRSAALVTDLGPGGRSLAVRNGFAPAGTLGSPELDESARAEAERVLASSGVVTARVAVADRDLLVEVWNPAPRLVIVGEAAVATALTAMAGLLGWSAVTTATVEASLVAVSGLSSRDAVIVIEHRADIAIPALAAALDTGVGYIGALGSRRTQAARRQALEQAGVTPAAVDTIHGPTGLDLGARTPMETAVSIVAEILAVRSGRDPAPLRTTTAPISP